MVKLIFWVFVCLFVTPVKITSLDLTQIQNQGSPAIADKPARCFRRRRAVYPRTTRLLM